MKMIESIAEVNSPILMAIQWTSQFGGSKVPSWSRTAD